VRAAQQARTREQADEISKTLTRTILTLPVLAGAGDRLYGSVTAADVADEIWRTRKIRVDRRKVQLEDVDYKDVNLLRRYISEKGKIRSRRITGACRRHQNQVSRAVKRAREMALLPYVAG
jgi:ribosomal protein S18